MSINLYENIHQKQYYVLSSPNCCQQILIVQRATSPFQRPGEDKTRFRVEWKLLHLHCLALCLGPWDGWSRGDQWGGQSQ